MTELQNKEILHQVYYERYKTGEVNKLLAILDTANRNIADILKTTKGIYTKQKYRKISKSIKEITDNLKDLIEQEIDVDGIIEAELKNQVKLFTQITQGKAEIKTPKVSAIREKAMFTPVVNQTFSQYIEGISKGAFQIWDNAVRTGYVTGQTTQQIVKTVMGSISTRIDMLESGTMQRLRNSVMANTKTQLQALANGTRMEFYEENTDLIKGYQWLSTLDKRTCQVCGFYEIQSSDKPFKGNEIPQIPHLSCRCVVIPVMKNDDFNQKFKRASMGGEVDGDTTYKTWFENQTEKVQRDILGTGKYNLWKNNEKVDITSFVSGGKVLTLKELQSLYD